VNAAKIQCSAFAGPRPKRWADRFEVIAKYKTRKVRNLFSYAWAVVLSVYFYFRSLTSSQAISEFKGFVKKLFTSSKDSDGGQSPPGTPYGASEERSPAASIVASYRSCSELGE
jgi:hypothetical protein